jgi:hypothetical protein
MGFHLFRRSFKIGSGLRETGAGFTDRTPITPTPITPTPITPTPITPIRQGRNTPGGMVAVFVLIGFLVVAIALFT